MNIFISGKPQFTFELNELEFTGLVQCCRHHYDSRCKHAENDILQQGKTYKELVEGATGYKLVNVSFREADTLCKCLENIRLMELSKLVTDDQAKALKNLYNTLCKALQEANNVGRTWVKELV